MRFWNKKGDEFRAKSVTDEWPKFKSGSWIAEDITIDGSHVAFKYLPNGRAVYFTTGDKNYRGVRAFIGQKALTTTNPKAPVKKEKKEKPVVLEAETVEDDDEEEIKFIEGTNPRKVKGEPFKRVTEELENEDAKTAAEWIRDNFDGARAKVMKYKGSFAVWSDTEVV